MTRPRDKAIWWLICSVFTLALGYAVFAFGSPIDPWRTRSVWITGVSALLMLAGLRVWRRFPLGWRAWIPALAWCWLLGYAIFMVWNAKARHALQNFKFEWLSPPWPEGPGTLSLQASSGAPLEIGALMLVFAAGWLAARRENLWLTLVKGVVVLGVAVSLFGILHKVTDAKAVWWLEDRTHGRYFFAPFVYHANAGAFLNLILPLAVAGGFSVGSGETGRGARWTWFGAAIVIFSAILVTASKGAILLVFGGLLLQLFAHRRRLRQTLREARGQSAGRRIEQALLFLALLAGVVVVMMIGWNQSLDRFEYLYNRQYLDEMTEDTRVRVAKVIWSMSRPDAGGVWGYGPGTFAHLFPYFTNGLEKQLPGLWLTGHNDWLQMLVEWGWIGGGMWALLGVGGLLAGFAALWKRRRLLPEEAPLIRGAMIGLAITGLHAAFDFPFQIYGVTVVAVLLCGMLWGKGTAKE